MIMDISINEALSLDKGQFIDVRAPIEYETAHIPGAVNLPLLTNEERAEIGVIYRHRGHEDAKNKGLEMVTPRLSAIIENLREISRGKQLVLYCWRGGDRSRAVAGLMEIMGMDAYRLEGGYKSYRQHVLSGLERLPDKKVAVLHGLTGTGKTVIIEEMNRMGWPTIDLEGLANHRGSVFGGIGLGDQPTQKQFETSIFDVLTSFQDFPGLVVESESKKIGRLFVPNHLHAMMDIGWHILAYDSMENRVDRLLQEYTGVHKGNIGELIHAVSGIEYFLGKKLTRGLIEMIEVGRLEGAVRILLEKYYDPLYGYPSKPDAKYDLCLDGADSRAAAGNFIAWLNKAERRDYYGITGYEAKSQA